MKNFTIGMVTGGAMAAIGIGCLLKDKQMCRQAIHQGKKMASKAEDIVDNIVDDILEY